MESVGRRVWGLSAYDLVSCAQQVCREKWWEQWRARKAITGPSATPENVGDQQVEGIPLVVILGDSGRPLANTLRQIGQRHKGSLCLRRHLPDLEKPVVLALKQVMGDDDAYAYCTGLLDWVYPVKEGKVQHRVAEVARIPYDHAGLLLHGTSMPCIELQRDPRIVNSGRKNYKIMCVMPDPTEAAGHELTDPTLKTLVLNTCAKSNINQMCT